MTERELADPRVWPAPGAANAASTRLHHAVAVALGPPAPHDAARADAGISRDIAQMLGANSGESLVDALDTAPSPAVARHLWQLYAAVERGDPATVGGIRTLLFALPVVIVAALERRGEAIVVPGVLSDVAALQTVLRDARALAGAQTFALSPVLAAAEAIGVGCVSAGRSRATVAVEGARADAGPIDVPPSPMRVDGVNERVFLRFVPGVVLAAPGFDPLDDDAATGAGLGVAQALAAQLRAPGVSLLALPRPPQRLVVALQSGRAMARDVAAQVFASNAIRRMRASVGEPTAVISAHRAHDAPGGGELRLSLSSPFAPGDAEGFRCPLYPYETVADVSSALVGLMRDCRVADVRIRGGVHADRDPVTGGPLLFKDAETPSASPLQ